MAKWAFTTVILSSTVEAGAGSQTWVATSSDGAELARGSIDSILGLYGDRGWDLVAFVAESYTSVGMMAPGNPFNSHAQRYRAVFKAPMA